jgi:hypothetical protein
MPGDQPSRQQGTAQQHEPDTFAHRPGARQALTALICQWETKVKHLKLLDASLPKEMSFELDEAIFDLYMQLSRH